MLFNRQLSDLIVYHTLLSGLCGLQFLCFRRFCNFAQALIAAALGLVYFISDSDYFSLVYLTCEVAFCQHEINECGRAYVIVLLHCILNC